MNRNEEDRHHDHLTESHMREYTRPAIDAIINDGESDDARSDLLDALGEFAGWRVDATHDKATGNEKYKELKARAESLEERLKAQICAQQWAIAEELGDARHRMSAMMEEMVFFAGLSAGLAFRGILGEFLPGARRGGGIGGGER